MKISIINPNLTSDPSILDVGITYLATYLNERTKHEASIIDFTYHRKDWTCNSTKSCLITCQECLY